MRNSIIDNISPGTLRSQLALELGDDIEHKKAFIILEGTADVKCMQKMFTRNTTRLFHARGGVDALVANCAVFCDDSRVIGIRDRDYDGINDVLSNLFYYDHCNLEMMIIGNDKAFWGFCDEYYYGDKSYDELREEVLRALVEISLIRMANTRDTKSIEFPKFPFKEMWNEETGKIDIDKVVEILLKINNHNNINECYIRTTISSRDVSRISYTELLDITNGHDFVGLFASVLYSDCKKIKKYAKEHGFCEEIIALRNLKNEEVESALHCAFTQECFRSTSLYEALLVYSREHNLRLFS